MSPAGTIRTHVATSNIGQTIKVGTGTTPQQSQAIFTVQAHQVQRQNASPVRLQTTAGGSLVALSVHQTPPGSMVVSAQNTVAIEQSPTVSMATHVIQQQHHQQHQQQQHQQQVQQQQQVRPTAKKRLHSFRFSKKP